MDPAFEGGAEISGPEANQGCDDYENRRWQIEAQTYRAPTPKIVLLRALWPPIVDRFFDWLHTAARFWSVSA
jgi:hypothetical protein